MPHKNKKAYLVVTLLVKANRSVPLNEKKRLAAKPRIYHNPTNLGLVEVTNDFF